MKRTSWTLKGRLKYILVKGLLKKKKEKKGKKKKNDNNEMKEKSPKVINTL